MRAIIIAALLGFAGTAVAQETDNTDPAAEIARLRAENAAKQRLIDQQGAAIAAAIKERTAVRKQAPVTKPPAAPPVEKVLEPYVGNDAVSARPPAPPVQQPMVAPPPAVRHVHMERLDIEKAGSLDGSSFPIALIWRGQSLPFDGMGPMMPTAGLNGECPAPATWVEYEGRRQCLYVGAGTPGLVAGNGSVHFGFSIPETPGSFQLQVVAFNQHGPTEPPHDVCTWTAWYGPRGSKRTVYFAPRSDCPTASGYQ